MRKFQDILRRGFTFYRMHGLLALIKVAPIYSLKEYEIFYSIRRRARRKNQQGKTRIFYIDHFTPTNSNFYWLKAFKNFGPVETFDIRKKRNAKIKKRILGFNPNHIHLGGSVKENMVPPSLLSEVRDALGCTISAFYGDARYSSYHSELAKVIDYVYISNRSHIKINEENGLENFKYMPCPTDPDVFGYEQCEKIYDLVFIGNNNQPARLPLLKRLASIFNLKVFGNGWKGTGLDHGVPVYGKEFSRVCNMAKICLGSMDPEWTVLEACFSNRLVNTLATRCFYIQTYTPRLETVFTNLKHLVWYTDEEDLVELIKYYLKNESEAEEIAVEGQKEVYEKYTYEKSVGCILRDAEVKSWRSHMDEDWQNALNGETAKGGERFTLKWYNQHPITIELFKSGILRGEILDLGCGIGTRAFLSEQRNNVRITGIDGSEYAINYAISNFKTPNLNFVCGNLISMPFKSGSFDNSYMLAVIEHIADTGTLLHEIKRVLKPGGRLFISVTEEDYHSDPGHAHIFTVTSLKDALADFTILNLYVKEHIIFATVEVEGYRER